MALLSSPLQIIKSTPATTREFVAGVVVLSVVNGYLRYHSEPPNSFIPYLTVVPGQSFLFPWTFFTAGFVEQNFLEVLLSLIFLAPSFRYLERLWGPFETAKFIAIVVVVSNFISFIINWVEYAVTGYEFFIYNTDYHGTMALQCAVLVAFTQLIPEHQVQFFGAFSIRVKRLPMIYVGVSNVLCIIGYQSPWLLIQFGWLVSWAYLRFYKRTTDALSGIDTYGDRSETFAFIHWFPPFVHKPLSLVSTATHNLAVKFKIIRPFSPSADDLETGVYSSLSNTQPGGARAEAERRRALALKALDSRLANAGSPSNSRPSTNIPRPGATSNGPSGSAPSPAPAANPGNSPLASRKSGDQIKGKGKESVDGQ